MDAVGPRDECEGCKFVESEGDKVDECKSAELEGDMVDECKFAEKLGALEKKEEEEEGEEMVDCEVANVAELSEEDREYWDRVRDVARLLRVERAELDVLPPLENLLEKMARPVAVTLGMLDPSVDKDLVVVAASRAVVEELPYVLNGSAPATPEADGEAAVKSYYWSLLMEAKRMLEEAPSPPRGWSLDDG